MNDKAKIDALRAALTELLRASVPGETIPTSLRRKAFKGAQEALALTSRIDEGNTADASEQAPCSVIVAGKRMIPDAECVQSKCACPTTGCWGECNMRRNPVLYAAPAAPVADTGAARDATLEEAAKIVDRSTNRTVASVAREIRSLKSLDTNK